MQGQLDIPLNETGRRQARAVAAVLGTEDFDALYSSDLSRVTQTAAPTAAKLCLTPLLDARLRERHYGMFERLTYVEVKEKHPELPITKAVKGMLPKNVLGREMLGKLKVYAGAEHPHKAQKPEPLAL